MQNSQTFLIWSVLLIAIIAFGVYYFFNTRTDPANVDLALVEVTDDTQLAFLDLLDKGGPTGDPRTADELVTHADEIGASVRVEDRDKAMAALDLVEKNKDVFPVSVRQRASYNAGVAFSESGDIQDVLDTVKTYKESIEDPETSAKWRARTLNLLATSYCAYGRDPRIIDEVFSTEPYAGMLRDAEDDPMAAAMAILHWSYDLYPTPRAAILIARGQALEAVNAGSSDERDFFIAEAEKWIEDADRVAKAELDRTVGKEYDYKFTRRYFSYRHWRTFTVSALALAGSEAHKAMYRDEHDNLFALMEVQGIENTKQYVPFCHWMYAYFLENIDGDTEAAEDYLIQAVEAAEAWDVAVDGTNYFEVFVFNEMAQKTVDIFGEMMEFAIGFSPEFRSYVNSVTK